MSIPTEVMQQALTGNFGGAGADDASGVLANLTRQQFQDYLSRFVPVENQLIQYATDPTQPLQQAQQAQGLVEAAYAAQPQLWRDTLAREGVTPTAAQSAAAQRQTRYQQGLAEVGAMNGAAQATAATQNQILSGSAQSLPGITQGLAAGLQGAAI